MQDQPRGLDLVRDAAQTVPSKRTPKYASLFAVYPVYPPCLHPVSHISRPAYTFHTRLTHTKKQELAKQMPEYDPKYIVCLVNNVRT